MDDLARLINSLQEPSSGDPPLAVATVVDISGSTYRRPGARMLIRRSGMTEGSVSAGCLEKDVIASCENLTADSQPFILTYDGTGGDEMLFGLKLGCQGVVQILIEPINRACPYFSKQVIRIAEAQSSSVAATIISADPPGEVSLGLAMVKGEDDTFIDDNLPQVIVERLRDLLDRKIESLVSGDRRPVTHFWETAIVDLDMAWLKIKVLIEAVEPIPRLLLVGQGPDVGALADMTGVLGWQVTAVRERTVDLQLSDFTACVIMTHNYDKDRDALCWCLRSDLKYIGLIGPRRRADKLLSELALSGLVLTPQDLRRLYSPAGLDIGAERPQEIALAILSEIKCVLSESAGGLLRHKEGPIHRPVKTDLVSAVVPHGTGNSVAKVAAVVLAAGGSRRLGTAKQLLKAGDSSLLESAIAKAVSSKCVQSLVVLGAYEDEIRAQTDLSAVDVLVNENWSQGIATSIVSAVDSLKALRKGNDVDGILFLTSDQPFVDTQLIDSLIERFSKDPNSIVCCRYEGNLGVPALFPRRFFAQLKELEGDVGARKVIMNNQDSTCFVDFPGGAIDVDTKEDWQRLSTVDAARAPSSIEQ